MNSCFIPNYYVIPSENKTYIKISLKFKGDFLDFDNIERELGLKPAWARKREAFPNQSPAAADTWIYSLGYNESLLVEEELRKFMQTLEGKIDIVNALKEQYPLMKSILTISIQATTKPYPLIPMCAIEFAYKTQTEIEFDPWYY